MYTGALIEALGVQLLLGEAVEDEQLELDSRCRGWLVRDVLNHSIAVTLKFAAFARGDTDAPRTPKGDHLGADHRSALHDAVSAAQAAWRNADLDRTCHLPFGSYPASIAAGINLFDVLAHCWDIAGPTGNPLSVPDRLWERGLAAAQLVIGSERDLDHYGPEWEVAPESSPSERFLAFLGRPERRGDARSASPGDAGR